MGCEIGIIGGSGLYDMEGLTDRREVTLDTPFGPPSGPFVTAALRGDAWRSSRGTARATAFCRAS